MPSLTTAGRRIPFPVCVLLCLAASLGAQAATPAPWLLSAADANADGDLDAAEWRAFWAALPRQGEAIERPVLLVRALYDRIDAQGQVTAGDLERIRAAFDPDGNGILEGSEAPTRRVPRGTSAEERFLGFLLLGAADGNGDGVVDAGEWGATVGQPEGSIPDGDLARWFSAAMANVAPGDRNAMSPGVTLLTYDAALDANQDGQVDGADARAHFAQFDANGDGRVSAAEIAAQRSAGFDRSRWEIRDEMRSSGPLMPWQRDLDDALALSKQTGKPLLLCVNMDGETASQTLALDRYRDPAFVRLAAGFIPLIVSPDRRNPRDYDDRGRRIPDPRFGRVINQEAIDGEPPLYERYFEGRRVAPRHVGVSPEGEVLFDLYLLQDLSVIDRALAKHGVPGNLPPASGLSLDELLASRDAGHRDALERRFLELDTAERVALAERALDARRDAQHPELLRLALLDLEPAVRAAAAASLAGHAPVAPLEMLVRAHARTGDPAMIAALRTRAETLTDEVEARRARRLAGVLEELAAPFPQGLDPRVWDLAFATAPTSSGTLGGPADLERVVELMEAALDAADRAPSDGGLRTLAAAAQLRFATVTLESGGNPQFLFDDAFSGARRATELDPSSGHAWALLSRAAYMTGDEATTLEAARRALPRLRLDANAELVLQVLDGLTQTLLRGVYSAVNADEPLPTGRVREARAAFEVLLSHPRATEAQQVAYLTFLGTLEAYHEQTAVVRGLLARNPGSATLHNWLRFCALRDDNAAGLERVYDERLAQASALDAAEIWFAGLASLVAAERFVEVQQPAAALAAYERSSERFGQSMELRAEYTGSASHYVALARAGRARLHADEKNWDRALEDLLAGVVQSPASATSADGLGNTPAQTARRLRRALVRAGEAEKARRLVDALAERGIEGFALAQPANATLGEAPAPPPTPKAEDLAGTPLEAFRREIGFEETDRWMTFDVVPSVVTETRRRIHADKRAIVEALLAHGGGEGFEAAPMQYPDGTTFVAESLAEDGTRLDTEVLIVRAGGAPEFRLFGPDGDVSETFAQPNDPPEGPEPGNVPRACLGCHLGNNYFEPMMSFPQESGARVVQVEDGARDRAIHRRLLEGYHRGSGLFGSYGGMLLSSLRTKNAAGTLGTEDRRLLERLLDKYPELDAAE